MLIYIADSNIQLHKEFSCMPEPIIRTEHLSRFFGTVKAVDDLSLEVPAGIVFGFLGPNGAGKTTTIHLLLGLLEPTQGQASVLGLASVPGGQARDEWWSFCLPHLVPENQRRFLQAPPVRDHRPL